MVKNNTFNGMPLPDIAVMGADKECRVIRRFGYEDFKGTIELFRDNEDIVEYLESLIGEIVPVKTVKDMNYAFDADIRKQGGKSFMVWDK